MSAGESMPACDQPPRRKETRETYAEKERAAIPHGISLTKQSRMFHYSLPNLSNQSAARRVINWFE